MKGTMMVISAFGENQEQIFPDARELHEAPSLETIKEAIGGGWLEKVPGFESIEVDNSVHPCVALCDEDGKRKQLQVNEAATGLWHQALLRLGGHPGLVTPYGTLADYLVGSIVILYGDDEFMESL
jgi:hypothetical protein